MKVVALFAVLLPEEREPIPSLGFHPSLIIMTPLTVCLVIIETEIPAATRQWKSFEVGTKGHSPSITAFAILIKGITTWIHTLWEMSPLVAGDGRLIGAAPLAIIEAANKDGFVLAMRLARPCRSTIRFL